MRTARLAVRLPAPRRASFAIGFVAAAAILAGAVPGAFRVPGTAAAIPLGYDVSWPNCSASPPSGTILSVVGVTGGKAFTRNPCLRAEYLAARHRGVVRFYLNLNSPSGSIGMSGPAGRCASTNLSCQAYNYGYRAAASAWAYAAGQLGTATVQTRWWLDVELTNSWSGRTSVNARVVAGALGFLRSRGHANRVGVYSTSYQWRTIVGTYRPGVSTWYATVTRSATIAARYCSSAYAFAGGPVRMVQFQPGGLDRDVICA